MKKNTTSHADKNRSAGRNGTRAKPAPVEDAAEAIRAVVREGEAEATIWRATEIKDPSLGVLPRDLAVMVERLRTSRGQAENKDRLLGMDAGEDFAKRRASYPMLLVTAEMAADYANPRCYDLEGGVKTLVSALASQLEARFDDSWDLNDLAEFLFPDGEGKKAPAFLGGFVRGAANTWHQIEALV